MCVSVFLSANFVFVFVINDVCPLSNCISECVCMCPAGAPVSTGRQVVDTRRPSAASLSVQSTLGQLWDKFETTLGQFRDHFEATLRQVVNTMRPFAASFSV